MAAARAPGAAQMLDRYGFELGKGVPQRAPSEAEQIKLARKENARAQKWREMIADWSTYQNGAGRKTLKKRVRKGIPDAVRGHVWQIASGAMAARHASSPNRYGALLSRPSPMDAIIEKDLHRTMPRHVQFQPGADGQRQLFNVCHALAVYAPHVGYNQAEAYVVAVLLTYLTEEDAFWMLVHLTSACRQGLLWRESMDGWGDYARKLDSLVHSKLPRLHRHLTERGVTPDLYALQWFLTLYSKDFPFESMLRVWDVLLCEPQPKAAKILFRVAIAILAEGEKELLKMDDIQQLTDHIRSLPLTKPALGADRLMARALRVSLKTNTLFPDLAGPHDQAATTM